MRKVERLPTRDCEAGHGRFNSGAYPGGPAPPVTKGGAKKERERREKEERKEGDKKEKDMLINIDEKDAIQVWDAPLPIYCRDEAPEFEWALRQKECTKSRELAEVHLCHSSVSRAP